MWCLLQRMVLDGGFWKTTTKGMHSREIIIFIQFSAESTSWGIFEWWILKEEQSPDQTLFLPLMHVSSLENQRRSQLSEETKTNRFSLWWFASLKIFIKQIEGRKNFVTRVNGMEKPWLRFWWYFIFSPLFSQPIFLHFTEEGWKESWWTAAPRLIITTKPSPQLIFLPQSAIYLYLLLHSMSCWKFSRVPPKTL